MRCRRSSTCRIVADTRRGGVTVGRGGGDSAGRRVAHANDDARAVILTGARGSFCSGLDLRDGEDDGGGGGGGAELTTCADLVVLSRDANVSFVHASRGASTRLRRRRCIVDFRTDRRLFGKYWEWKLLLTSINK
jgi:hypothetical protein